MKIWYQFPRPVSGVEKFYERLQANWEKVRKQDSELVIKAPTRGAGEFRYSILGHSYADFLRTIEMVEGVIQAEKEGYDAAVIGCFGDGGLDVLEDVVDIPVIGPCKAAIMMAQKFGHNMAFITVPNWERKIRANITAYGIEDMVINNPVRAFTIPLEQFKEEEKVAENFFEIAKDVINDGADVILSACVNTSTMLTYKDLTYVDGVPVIDGAITALKMAEVMVDYKRAGLWRSKKTVPNDVIEGLRKEYYHGSESR